MLSKRLNSQIIIYHFILFFSFSLSVNYFFDLKFINYLAYVFFHLTLIYLVFYYFHFILFFISFIYGIFFDIFLIDNISPHLISFLFFIFLFYFTRKYLFNFSSTQISFIIIIIAFIMFIAEAIIANILFNYSINIKNLGWLFVTTIVIFFPFLILFSRIDEF